MTALDEAEQEGRLRSRGTLLDLIEHVLVSEVTIAHGRVGNPDPIRAFTLTFDRVEYDEEKEAREMAATAGAEFYPISMRQHDLADNFVAATLLDSLGTMDEGARVANDQILMHLASASVLQEGFGLTA